MNDELLIKFLLKETTDKEIAEINEWLAADTENTKYFSQLEKIWTTSEKLAPALAVDVDLAWASFKAKVDKTNNQPLTKPLKYNFAWLSAVAAVLIAFGAWAIYSLMTPLTYTQIGTGNAVINKILPDGTELTLNKNTSINYAENFERNRSVHLKKGEVFFNVAHDRAHPFVININNIEVEVVGTSFNIKHLNEETEVVVESGTVKLTLGGETIKLVKNERILISPATKELQKEQSNDQLYNYYRTKIFEARNTPLHKLVGILNEAYGSNVVVDPQVKDMTIYITLEFSSLEQNLKYICDALKLKISRNQSEIKLSY